MLDRCTELTPAELVLKDREFSLPNKLTCQRHGRRMISSSAWLSEALGGCRRLCRTLNRTVLLLRRLAWARFRLRFPFVQMNIQGLDVDDVPGLNPLVQFLRRDRLAFGIVKPASLPLQFPQAFDVGLLDCLGPLFLCRRLGQVFPPAQRLEPACPCSWDPGVPEVSCQALSRLPAGPFLVRNRGTFRLRRKVPVPS